MDVYHSRSQCMTTAKIVCMFSCARSDGSVSAKDLMNGAENQYTRYEGCIWNGQAVVLAENLLSFFFSLFFFLSFFFFFSLSLFFFTFFYMLFSFRDSSSGMDPASAKAEVRSARCSVVNYGSCVWMTSRRSSTNRAWRNSLQLKGQHL